MRGVAPYDQKRVGILGDAASAGVVVKTERQRRRCRLREDPFYVGGGELLGVGWILGLPVGGSLGWAIWVGHVGPVRSSLAMLATAATVVIVLGFDAFRRGGGRGLEMRARRVFGGTAVWVMVLGVLGVVLAAAALPWLGPPGPLLGSRQGEAVFIGVAGFVLGVVLGAPLALASNRERPKRRAGESTRGEAPAPGHAAGVKARASEFMAPSGDPFCNDTLGRREQVERFCGLVRGTATPVVWAVEGSWGSGKTAFSRMCAAILRSEPDVGEVVPVNGMTQGVTGVPIVDLAVTMGRALESVYRGRAAESRRRRGRLADLATALSEPAILLDVFGRGDAPAADATGEMARLIRQYADSANGLVVVWIDELDRCPPDYALGMLRAVRSICDHPGVATVVTVNPDALEEAVVRMHGALDGAERFLRRFIDMRVTLSAPGADDFERSENRAGFLRAIYGDTGLPAILADAPFAGAALESLARGDSLSLRDLEQIVHHAGIVCSAIPVPPVGAEVRSNTASGRFDPEKRAREARSDTITAAVALGILRFTDPETYRDAATQAWASRDHALEFFGPVMVETGRSFAHPATWPADPLAAAISRVAARRADEGADVEEIAGLVSLSGGTAASRQPGRRW